MPHSNYGGGIWADTSSDSVILLNEVPLEREISEVDLVEVHHLALNPFSVATAVLDNAELSTKSSFLSLLAISVFVSLLCDEHPALIEDYPADILTGDLELRKSCSSSQLSHRKCILLYGLGRSLGYEEPQITVPAASAPWDQRNRALGGILRLHYIHISRP